MCSDCQIALVPELSSQAGGDDPGAPGDESFTLAWAGGEPWRHAEVLELLKRENIPATTLRGRDFFVLPSTHQPFEIYVPSSYAKRAEAILDAEESEGLDTAGSAHQGNAEFHVEDDIQDSQQNNSPGPDWHPDDATAEIWSGEDWYVAEMIAMSLRENQIECRTDPEAETDPGDAPPTAVKIYVLPDDEARAKEIVREITDAAPPE